MAKRQRRSNTGAKSARTTTCRLWNGLVQSEPNSCDAIELRASDTSGTVPISPSCRSARTDRPAPDAVSHARTAVPRTRSSASAYRAVAPMRTPPPMRCVRPAPSARPSTRLTRMKSDMPRAWSAVPRTRRNACARTSSRAWSCTARTSLSVTVRTSGGRPSSSAPSNANSACRSAGACTISGPANRLAGNPVFTS